MARYWHDSLAGQLLGNGHRNASDVEKMVRARGLVDSTGCVEPAIVEAAFKRLAKRDQRGVGAATAKPVPAVFYPYVYKRAFHSGAKRGFGMPDYVLPIGIPGEIDEDGGFTPLEPLIARDILAPSSDESLTIASIADYDSLRGTMTPPVSAASHAPRGRQCIEATAHYARRLHEELLQEALVRNDYVRQDHVLFALGESLVDTAAGIRRTYEHIERTGRFSPLFAQFASLEDVPLKEAPADLLDTFSERVGAATDKHGLAEAQRVALGELMRIGEGEILAVNGPPGTGKTTMVLSVVASMWINAALSGEPLVILASSANNQAVTNILDAFAKDFATGAESYPSFSGRWLPDVSGFGAYLPAAGRRTEARAQQRITDEWHEAYASPDNLRKYRRFFLKKASAAEQRDFNLVEEAVAWLQASLEEVVLSIKNMSGTVHAAYGPDVAALEEGLAQAEAGTLLPAKSLGVLDRLARIFGIGTRNLTAYNHNQAVLARRTMLADSLAVARAREQAARSALQSRFGPQAQSRAGVDDAADTSERFFAFLLATHYWEGRYLLELEEVSRSPKAFENFQKDWLDQQERRYRLWGMLTPCFVATFYSLPSRFSGAVRDSGKILKHPMIGFADLLVVDEAGQAAPEIAGAAFQMAKRALVIGDVDQIEPVWSATMPIDKGDAWKNGIVRKGDEAHWEAIGNKGLLASNGVVMRIAQRATSYWTEPSLQRGLYLYDHYRCWNEIIQFSNDRTHPLSGALPVE
jgi:hypothetical protein